MIKKRIKRWLRRQGLMSPPAASAHRRAGDQARDQGSWTEARASYRLHLDARPGDGPIWAQYGHTLRELGQWDAAEAAYRESARLQPAAADPWLHLGHMYGARGQFDRAADAYRDAHERGDPGAGALALKAAKSARCHPSEPAPPGMILYSVQDMLNYLQVHALFTGIQRVQAGIALHLLREGGEGVGFILTDAVGGGDLGHFWLMQKEDLAAVINYVASSQVDHDALRRLLLTCELNARLIHADDSHTIVLLGAFWGLGNTPERYLEAKRAGARIGAYIYDIIPLSHPQFCEAELTGYFSEHMGPLCYIADFFLTISDYTRITFETLLRELDMRVVPMATVGLAHEMTEPKTRTEIWPKALASVSDRPFVAYVSTVEGRKNHLYVVRVWQQLIATGLEVPDLIFVGRKGWRIDPLMALLEETANLDGRVHIVHDLSDAELNAIYERAEFTVFTSTIEGWGLPVGESLMHGTPCVASRAASIPEVGGDFVDYVDPSDLEEGVRVIGRMIRDHEYLAERRNHIRHDFKPKTWDDVGRDFDQKVRFFSASPALPIAPVPLDRGRFLNLSRNAAPLDPMVVLKTPVNLLLDRQLYEREFFGCWMKGHHAVFQFMTDLLPGTPIVVKVGICTPEQGANFNLFIQVGEERARAKIVRPIMIAGTHAHLGQSLVTLEGYVESDGRCSITLHTDEMPPDRGADPRKFLIGVRGLGYAPDTMEGRLALLEGVLAS